MVTHLDLDTQASLLMAITLQIPYAILENPPMELSHMEDTTLLIYNALC